MLDFKGVGKLLAVYPIAFACLLISIVSSHFVPVCWSNDLASKLGTAADAAGNNCMGHKLPHRRRNATGAKFRFEHLEPRHLFAASPLDGASLLEQHEDLLEPPSLEQYGDVPLDIQSSELLLGTQSAPPLTNFDWQPMVYAGPNSSVGAFNVLQLNAEVLLNSVSNLTIQWSKLAGPGIATFSNSLAIDSTVQFDQAGTYELQLSVTNHGVIASDRIFVTVSTANVVNIDQSWLNAQGPGPYYLDQQGKTYVLQTDVTSDGTAFAIIAKDVTFDLNGHTITYDNAAPITIPNGSFEAGNGAVASGWDFSTAPSATRHEGVWLHNEVYNGDHSLKFTLPSGDQYVSSTTTITLEANTTYSLSAMFEYGGQGVASNPGVVGYVRLVGDGVPTREVLHATGNNRGIQLREGTFTTGNTTETYNIQVGVEGGAALDPATAKPFYIDDIKIQRTNVYGVTAATKNWSPADYPGITQWGTGTNATIKNGTIIQGTEGATWAHGVFIHTTDGVTIQNLDITVHGANSSAICGKDQGVSTSSVFGNTLTSNVKTISSRDNFYGAVIFRLQGEIFNNTITNGVHAGIVAANGTSSNRIASNIYGNTIQLSARYTNGFAIIASWGSQIHDNLIDSGSGDFGTRGILVSSGDPNGTTTRVYDNTIHVQLHVDNQEYEGAVIGGAYGIQMENAKNVEVYGNDVYAYGNEVPAYAFRMNSDGGTSDGVHVHDNTFRAIANGSHASALKFTRIAEESLRFENNELITNDGIVGTTDSSFVTLLRSRITVDAPINDPYPVESDWTSGQGLHTRITFLDTTFADTASRSYLESASVRIASRYGGAVDDKMAFDVRWTTTAQVSDAGGAGLSNATVSITNKTGTEVVSGMTDTNGQFIAALTQFSTQGNAKTVFNPFTVTVMANGEQTQHQFTADRVQTIQLQSTAEASGSSMQMQGDLENPVMIPSGTVEPMGDYNPDVFSKQKTTSPNMLSNDIDWSVRGDALLLYAASIDEPDEYDPLILDTLQPSDASLTIDAPSYLRTLDSYFDDLSEITV